MSTYEVDFQRFQEHIQRCIQNEAKDVDSVLGYLAGKANPDAFVVLQITFPTATEQVVVAAKTQDDLIRRRTIKWPCPEYPRLNHNLRQIIGDAKVVLATPEKQAAYREWLSNQEYARAQEAQAASEKQERERANKRKEVEEQHQAAEREREQRAQEERARKWQWLRLILINFVFWAVLFTVFAFIFPALRIWLGILAMSCAVVAWRQTPRTAFLRRRIVDIAFYGAAGLVFITVVHIPGFGSRDTPTLPSSNPASVPAHKSPEAIVIKTASPTSRSSAPTQEALAASQRQTVMLLAGQKVASAKRVNNEISAKLISLQDQQQRGLLTEVNAVAAKTEMKPLLQKALADSEFAISLDSNNKDAWFQRVCTLYFWGKYPEADHYLREATVKFPECNDFDPIRPLIEKHLR